MLSPNVQSYFKNKKDYEKAISKEEVYYFLKVNCKFIVC